MQLSLLLAPARGTIYLRGDGGGVERLFPAMDHRSSRHWRVRFTFEPFILTGAVDTCWENGFEALSPACQNLRKERARAGGWGLICRPICQIYRTSLFLLKVRQPGVRISVACVLCR